jgi:hypothetical protein
MKYNYVFYFLFLALLVTVSACSNKSCEGIVCGPNKQCAQGECYCADGYEGSSCTDLAYTKYIRSYLVQENCQGTSPNTPPNTNITIYQGTQLNRVVLSGFLGMGLDVVAIIRTDQANRGNTLEIPRQNLGGVTVEGYGTYNTPQAGQISFEFTYTYNGTPYSCQQRFYPI